MQFILSESIDDEIFTNLPCVKAVEHKGNRINIKGTGDLTTEVLYALFDIGVRASQIEVINSNLEDAFVNIIQKDDETNNLEVNSK